MNEPANPRRDHNAPEASRSGDRSLGGKTGLQKPRRAGQRGSSLPIGATPQAPAKDESQMSPQSPQELLRAKLLVELLVLCERLGIIRVNREWLAREEGTG